jgi:gas vesicle protein
VYRDSGRNELLVGLLVGAIAGLGIGLLLAPKAGSQTREMLWEGVNRGVDRIRQLRNDQG